MKKLSLLLLLVPALTLADTQHVTCTNTSGFINLTITPSYVHVGEKLKYDVSEEMAFGDPIYPMVDQFLLISTTDYDGIKYESRVIYPNLPQGYHEKAHFVMSAPVVLTPGVHNLYFTLDVPRYGCKVTAHEIINVGAK